MLRRIWLAPAVLLSGAALIAGSPSAEPLDANILSVVQDGTCAYSIRYPRIVVRVHGISNENGGVRVNVYNDNPDEFLEKGKKVARVDLPAQAGSMEICLQVPHAGTYAVVALHDKNGNGKTNILKDGFGASNNPPGYRKPKHREVTFEVGPDSTELDVTIKYLFGGNRKKPRS